MSDTTTLAKTWPTGDELDRIRTALDDAVNELDEITIAYTRLIDVEVAPGLKDGVLPPTFDDIGVLASIVFHAEFHLDNARGHLDRLRNILREAPFEKVWAVTEAGRA